MKRISVMVADDAKKVLVDWKDKQGFTTLDEAMESLLTEFRTSQKSLGELIAELDATKED